MKERSAHSLYTRGFNTLEIIIALALMIVVIIGAVDANTSAQYWSITSETSTEALYKAKTIIEQVRATASADFQSASSTVLTRSENPLDPADASCLSGGLCYLVKSTVHDISSCSKYAGAYVEWRIGEGRYPTSTEELYTNLTNNTEISALGGDCVLNEPEGDWFNGSPSSVGGAVLSHSFITGIDVLQKKIYIVSSSSPQFRVYSVPSMVGQDPALVGSTVGSSFRLNGLDVMRDLSTGRTYAFVAQHASTSQLAVIDTTDATSPVLVTKRTLSGVDQTGSYPEGWRVLVYGGRLYVVTRETTGPELHIFNINAPTQPSEIVSAKRDINRTVNDMVVREQMVAGSVHRYLFLASSADLKELSIFDVTGDSPTEVVALDLPGGADGQSLFLTGDRLYFGRESSSEAELSVFSVSKLLDGATAPLAQGEVGANVQTIRGTGSVLFLGTSKSGEEFQVWEADTHVWDPSTLNAGRVSYTNVPRLAPLGIDLNVDWVYQVSQSFTQPEALTIMYHTP